MSYDFEKSNSHRGWADAPTITGYPWAIGCWFKAESIADGDTIIALGNSADPNPLTRIQFNASSQLAAWRRTFSGNTSGVITPGVTCSTATWYFAAFIAAGRYSHKVYLNTSGYEYTTDMEDWTSSNDLNRIGLGNLYRGTSGTSTQDYFDGLIAEYAIWTSDLTAENISSLAGGAPANSVGTIAHWWRMNSDTSTTLSDAVGSTSITLAGGTGNPVYSADHPTIGTASFVPRRTLLGVG